MKVLILALIPIFGFAVGVLLARHSLSQDRLPRNDRKELINARNLIDELSVSAAEHTAMGDNYASIVLDEIRKYKKGIL